MTRTFHGDAAALGTKLTPYSEVATILWSQLTTGTIAKLHNREMALADLLILSVTEYKPEEPGSVCYVEIKSLDGEANLKLWYTCDATLHAPMAQEIAQLQGFLCCETPNRVIGRVDGTQSQPVDRSNQEYPAARLPTVQH